MQQLFKSSDHPLGVFQLLAKVKVFFPEASKFQPHLHLRVLSQWKHTADLEFRFSYQRLCRV